MKGGGNSSSSYLIGRYSSMDKEDRGDSPIASGSGNANVTPPANKPQSAWLDLVLNKEPNQSGQPNLPKRLSKLPLPVKDGDIPNLTTNGFELLEDGTYKVAGRGTVVLGKSPSIRPYSWNLANAMEHDSRTHLDSGGEKHYVVNRAKYHEDDYKFIMDYYTNVEKKRKWFEQFNSKRMRERLRNMS